MDTNSMGNSPQPDQGTDENASPIDSLISRVASYKQNPSLVTPETLDQLLTELQDLKAYIDSEEQQPSEPQADDNSFSGEVMRNRPQMGGGSQ